MIFSEETWVILLIIGAQVLLIAIAIPMLRRKVKPNWYYGVRTRATLNNESLWYDANAYGGKALIAASAASLVATLLLLASGMPFDEFAALSLTVTLIAVGIAIVLIFRYVARYSQTT